MNGTSIATQEGSNYQTAGYLWLKVSYRIVPAEVGEPLMGFANGRNFRDPPPAYRLRDGVSGSPLIAD